MKADFCLLSRILEPFFILNGLLALGRIEGSVEGRNCLFCPERWCIGGGILWQAVRWLPPAQEIKKAPQKNCEAVN